MFLIHLCYWTTKELLILILLRYFAISTTCGAHCDNLDFGKELEFTHTFFTPLVTPARTAEMQHWMPPQLLDSCVSIAGNSAAGS